MEEVLLTLLAGKDGVTITIAECEPSFIKDRLLMVSAYVVSSRNIVQQHTIGENFLSKNNSAPIEPYFGVSSARIGESQRKKGAATVSMM